jgi:UDP-3-O-[3-hydroxymyristoyl] glucosamine N-acyltransferase
MFMKTGSVIPVCQSLALFHPTTPLVVMSLLAKTLPSLHKQPYVTISLSVPTLHIAKGATIGDNVVIDDNVKIGKGTTVADGSGILDRTVVKTGGTCP